MVNRIIQFVGVVALLAIGIATGFWLAWNIGIVGTIIAQTGGIIPLIGALIAVAATFLAVFWPKQWSGNLHRVVIAVVILTAIIGRDLIIAAFTQASWPVILITLGVIIGLWIAITWAVYGQLLPRLPRIRIRRSATPAPAAPAAGA